MTGFTESDEIMKRSIRQHMDVKNTEELLYIYADHDSESWIPETFDIVKAILLERGISAADLADLSQERIDELTGKHFHPKESSKRKQVPEFESEQSANLSVAQKTYLYQSMLNKDTDELLDIYTEHDTGSWVPQVFGIIQEVLRERGYSDEELRDLSPLPVMNEEGTYDLVPTKMEKRYVTNPSTPQEIKKAAIWQRMSTLETEELLNIYAAHDTDSWTPLTFAVVRDLLIERGWPEDEVDDLILADNDVEEEDE